ncbi:MAG TPA: pitrilysin family protein [Gemmatimonadales bacterium]|nr:pitrilysin family protein [Gemmatimonadales bacterium]
MPYSRPLTAALVALGALWPGRGLAAQSAALQVPVVVDTLDNGLVLMVHEDASAPIVNVNVWYHVGSGDEKPGRTGFAHLFEHLMFMGSEHAPYPEFDRRLEAAGANNNGSTTEDRTNYYEEGPANALPLMLWLEADRMGWMLPTMDSAKVDLQRDVVKNERRQSYENQPYGMVWDHLPRMLYDASHPYSWPVIGSMADLSAASLEDVKQFFREYYAPNNAAIVIAGNVKAADVKALAERYFGAIPRGPEISRPTPVAIPLRGDTLLVLEDRVQLPRLYYAWHTVKGWAPDDAALDLAAYVLTGAKNSRLTKEMVYEEQTASSVSAFQDGKRLAGEFMIIATARPGTTLPTLQQAIDAEIARLASDGPTSRELQQAQNAFEASFLDGLESVGRKADRLNAYFYALGVPDSFQRDADRYRAVTADDIRRVVRTYLTGPRAVISVVPQGQTRMAARERMTP